MTVENRAETSAVCASTSEDQSPEPRKDLKAGNHVNKEHDLEKKNEWMTVKGNKSFQRMNNKTQWCKERKGH